MLYKKMSFNKSAFIDEKFKLNSIDQELIQSNRKVEVHWLSNEKEIDKNKRSVFKRRSLENFKNAKSIDKFCDDIATTSTHSTRSTYLNRSKSIGPLKNKSNSTYTENLLSFLILFNQQPSQCYKSGNQFRLILMIQFFIFLIVRHVHCQQVYPPNQFK